MVTTTDNKKRVSVRSLRMQKQEEEEKHKPTKNEEAEARIAQIVVLASKRTPAVQLKLIEHLKIMDEVEKSETGKNVMSKAAKHASKVLGKRRREKTAADAAAAKKKPATNKQKLAHMNAQSGLHAFKLFAYDVRSNHQNGKITNTEIKKKWDALDDKKKQTFKEAAKGIYVLSKINSRSKEIAHIPYEELWRTSLNEPDRVKAVKKFYALQQKLLSSAEEEEVVKQEKDDNE